MEGLKLIDLGNEVSYIDVDTSKVPYTFSVKLGDRTFAFSIMANSRTTRQFSLSADRSLP